MDFKNNIFNGPLYRNLQLRFRICKILRSVKNIF